MVSCGNACHCTACVCEKWILSTVMSNVVYAFHSSFNYVFYSSLHVVQNFASVMLKNLHVSSHKFTTFLNHSVHFLQTPNPDSLPHRSTNCTVNTESCVDITLKLCNLTFSNSYKSTFQTYSAAPHRCIK